MGVRPTTVMVGFPPRLDCAGGAIAPGSSMFTRSSRDVSFLTCEVVTLSLGATEPHLLRCCPQRQVRLSA
jgi:hypothetical protein